MVPPMVSSSSLRILNKYREKEEKKAFMMKNGSILLEELIASSDGKYNPIRIFSYRELKMATNKFSKLNLVKRATNYMLYKGFMEERSILVMKFLEEPNTLDRNQCCFNNIAFASQMCHKNVWRLIGCCLETQTPILVFESVKYDTLEAHIYHNSEHYFEPLLWTRRLKIAMEIANAIAYLVSRNIKLQNVFFDEEYVAKLFDFTLSAFILEGETHTNDGLKSTTGYVAPEYIMTFHFNEKCDVYSFGLMLLQLLTKRRLFEFDYDDPILSESVHRYNQDNRVSDIVDPIIVGDGLCPQKEQQIKVFTELALKCVSELADDRPTIVEVAKQLRQLYLSSM